MKKLIALLIALVIVFVISSCSDASVKESRNDGHISTSEYRLLASEAELSGLPANIDYQLASDLAATGCATIRPDMSPEAFVVIVYGQYADRLQNFSAEEFGQLLGLSMRYSCVDPLLAILNERTS
jgi:hypothetical protein